MKVTRQSTFENFVLTRRCLVLCCALLVCESAPFFQSYYLYNDAVHPMHPGRNRSVPTVTELIFVSAQRFYQSCFVCNQRFAE